MATITDSLGTWEQLGTVAPGEDWQLFPETIINSELFRFTCLYNDYDWGRLIGFRSFGVLRFYYPTSELTISQTFRLFVKTEPQIIEKQIPESFKNSGILLRDIGVKRVKIRAKSNFLVSPQTFLPWSLKGEYLVSENTNQSIEQKLDNLIDLIGG